MNYEGLNPEILCCTYCNYRRHRYANVLHLPQPIVQNSDHRAAGKSLRLAAARVGAAAQVEVGLQRQLGPVVSEPLFGGWSAFADDNIQETLKLRRD